VGIVASGAGEVRCIGGECLTLKVRGADTDRALAVLEDTVQPGYGPPPHIHLYENESFYVLEGEFAFTLDDEKVSAPAGTTVNVPKGHVHTFQNIGSTPGRLLAIVWPAVAFEAFVAEVGTPKPGPPDIAKLLDAAARHGIEIPPGSPAESM
jgi:mannose-6-phosphate isomerase-like protein (cupin superfamily)